MSNVKTTLSMEQVENLSPNAPCSRPITVHYSFDFAQQVHYPSNALQPGPVYFKTTRKCALLGIRCEGLPQQVNYLIDKKATESKGANAVISYLHHFLENYGLGECDLQLQCDNCTGQNKNSAMLWYLAWRVTTGLHKTVSLNFLIAGRTKFSPDWCFDPIKQKFRKTNVSCWNDIAHVVRKSTSSCCNCPQLVASKNDIVNVELYDWQSFLKNYFRTFPNLLSYHHFHFKYNSVGEITAKQYNDSAKVVVNIARNRNIERELFPEVLEPPGLSLARKRYLFEQIRKFCAFEYRDTVCPLPSESKCSSSAAQSTTDGNSAPLLKIQKRS